MTASFIVSKAAEQWHDTQTLSQACVAHPLDLTIFVSCYNEADLIENTLETIRQAMHELSLSYEIIVIDDVSQDRSVAVVERYIAAHPEMCIVLRKNQVNQGLAQNYGDAAFLGKGKYYRLICGDNSEPVHTIRTVLQAIGSADIIVPYYTASEGRSAARKWISCGFTAIVNLLTGYKLQYYNGLAVHLRYNVMRWHPHTRGFGFQAELLCMLLDKGYSYHEVAVTTEEKRQGKSNALTLRNLLSIAHSLLEILFRRMARTVYGR